MTTSEEELINRLRGRKSESDQQLQLRIESAREEIDRMSEFDFCVVNAEGQQEEAVANILSIVDATLCRLGQRPLTL